MIQFPSHQSCALSSPLHLVASATPTRSCLTRQENGHIAFNYMTH